EVRAAAGGVVTAVDALAVGVAAWRLGAGRSRPGEQVQAAAGVVLHARVGDRVGAGDLLMTLQTDTPERFDRAEQALDGAVTISTDAAAGPPDARRSVVLERVG
ncbi:pyrimidine nucleoside phosphorylase domain protein, partial [Aeromicrobium marinum DSM 15272]